MATARLARFLSGVRTFIARHGAILLALLPPLLLLWMMLRYGVDAPYWDQWKLVPLLDKLWSGRLTFADIAAQHNEHRLFFPRLLMLSLAWLTRWDIRWELGLNYVLGVGIFALLGCQIRRTAREVAWPGLAWALPVCSVVVFSVAQFENWLWGWQMQVLLNVLTACAGFMLLSRPGLGWRGLAGAALLGLVATHSFANGVLFWPLGLALLAAVRPRGQRAGPLLAWAACSVLALVSFAWNYHLPADHQRLGAAAVSPAQYGGYVLRYLGNICAQFQDSGFRSHGDVALLCGLGACAAAAWCLWRLARCKSVPTLALLPYAAFLGYSLLSGMMTGVGRLDLGLQQALSSRYCTVTVPFWVAVIVLLMLRLKPAPMGEAPATLPRTQRSGGRAGALPRPAFVLLALAGALLALSSLVAVAEARNLSQRLAHGRAALLALSDPAADTNRFGLTLLYPERDYVVAQCPVLLEHRLSVFRNGATGRVN